MVNGSCTFAHSMKRLEVRPGLVFHCWDLNKVVDDMMMFCG